MFTNMWYKKIYKPTIAGTTPKEDDTVFQCDKKWYLSSHNYLEQLCFFLNLITIILNNTKVFITCANSMQGQKKARTQDGTKFSWQEKRDEDHLRFYQ